MWLWTLGRSVREKRLGNFLWRLEGVFFFFWWLPYRVHVTRISSGPGSGCDRQDVTDCKGGQNRTTLSIDQMEPAHQTEVRLRRWRRTATGWSVVGWKAIVSAPLPGENEIDLEICFVGRGQPYQGPHISPWPHMAQTHAVGSRAGRVRV